MKKYLIIIYTIATLSLGVPALALAQSSTTVTPTNSPAMLNKLKSIGGKAGYDSATSGGTLLSVVGTVVNIVLSLLGIVFIILIIIAGFNWMTAGGDEERIKKSGETIKSAIIGLLIVIGAFAIWMFISNALIDDGYSNNSGYTDPQ